jgi:hypothetical protein
VTILTSDPWAHRSDGMRCKTCMWFVPKEANDRITDLGRCRRHAPSATGFVPVFVNDWCGDHRLDENRVAEGCGRGIADAQRTDAMRHELELELEAARKERDHYLSAFEELQRDNESLSRALDRMTDKAASLAGIKP